jgi:hypothetical protein
MRKLASDGVGPDAKGSGAPRGVGCGHASRIEFLAQDQLDDAAVEIGTPFDRKVALCLFRFQKFGFGEMDRPQDGCTALLVFEDADGQVDLVRSRILFKGFSESEDGIGRGEWKGFKHDGQEQKMVGMGLGPRRRVASGNAITAVEIGTSSKVPRKLKNEEGVASAKVRKRNGS